VLQPARSACYNPLQDRRKERVVAIPRNIRLLGSVCLLLLLVLAACSGGGAPTPTAAPAAPAASRTVLILWHAWPASEARTLAAIVERFNRATPNVQVVLQSRPGVSLRADLEAAVAEGGGPHIALIPGQSLGALVDAGSLLPIDGLLPAESFERLLPAAVGAAQVSTTNGIVRYGVPLSFDTMALFYNKAYFTGDPPANTDELLSVARGGSDTASDPPFWGLAYNLSLDRTIGYLYAFDGQIFDADGRLALGLDGRAGVEAWLGWLLELNEDPRILASLNGVRVDNAVMAQQAAMTIDWSHAVETYNALWPGNLGVAPLPLLADSSTRPQPLVQSDMLVLNARLGAQTEQPAAVAFARFFIEEAAQRELLRAGRQPVLLSLDLNEAIPAVPDELLAAARVFRAQGEAGLPMPNSRLSTEVIWPMLADMQGSALRRLQTPEQAVEATHNALRARIEGE
jgi:ABC-type glycerol-3-phosphate transport system substrate-binding protein